MDRYNQRPPQVDAIQLRDATWPEIQAVLGVQAGAARTITAAEATDTCGDPGPDYLAVDVPTIYGGTFDLAHGDWLVIHSPDNYERRTPATFAATYEAT